MPSKQAQNIRFEIIHILKAIFGIEGIRTCSTTTRDRNLQFRGTVSTGFLNFSPLYFPSFSRVFCVLLVRKSLQNVEKIAQIPDREKGQNPVTSLAARRAQETLCRAGPILSLLPKKASHRDAPQNNVRNPSTTTFQKSCNTPPIRCTVGCTRITHTLKLSWN